MLVKDVKGKRFGNLLAQERVLTVNGYRWICLCDCGNTTVVSLGNLGRATKSCGCLRKIAASQRGLKPIKHVISTQIRNYYQRNAKLRNITWSLTDEQFNTLIFDACYYCGQQAGTITKTTWLAKGGKRELPNNGVDRLNTELGYTPDNCVTACKTCNLAKNKLTVDEFISWARHLVMYQDSQNGGA